MKKIIEMKQNKLVFSLMLLFSLGAGILHAQTFEKSRQINRSFPVSNETEVEISNKYGNVHVVPWDKDSVRFEINILVKGTKQAKVDKTYSLIDIDFESTKYYVIAKTVFQGNSFWNDVTDIGSSFFGSNTKTRIDYTIYLPDNIELKLSDKYGNIYMDDYRGVLTVNLSNGDFKAHDLTGRTTIQTEFGNSDVRKIINGKLNINYGEFYLEEGGLLNITSKSSEFYLTNVEEIEMSSKRDKFIINSLGKLRGNAYFSRVELDLIGEAFDFSSKYGDLKIKSFGYNCSSFKLKTDDTDVTLIFADDKQYNLSILIDEDTKVYYSSTITDIKSKDIEGDEKKIEVDCRIGDNKQQVLPMSIESLSGSLSLKRK